MGPMVGHRRDGGAGRRGGDDQNPCELLLHELLESRSTISVRFDGEYSIHGCPVPMSARPVVRTGEGVLGKCAKSREL